VDGAAFLSHEGLRGNPELKSNCNLQSHRKQPDRSLIARLYTQLAAPYLEVMKQAEARLILENHMDSLVHTTFDNQEDH